jgi:hypothetical protein
MYSKEESIKFNSTNTVKLLIKPDIYKKNSKKNNIYIWIFVILIFGYKFIVLLFM